jgi:uncharacterized protein
VIGSSAELIGIVRQFNPWWAGRRYPDLPGWRRAMFQELDRWATAPAAPTTRALLVDGARQVGKTTLFLQVIDSLIERGVPAANILYATFDHPLLRVAGLETVMRLWREQEPAADGPEYLFLDEIQYAPDWQIWLKHQVDFDRRRRIALTGSAMPLANESQESGVGRWQSIRLPTLSFYEFLQLRRMAIPPLPLLTSLREVQAWSGADIARIAANARPLVGYFHDYLLRGGFPQTAQVETVTLAQKLLREDIIDKILKRDMTALFGVRRMLELEQVFLYLCLHDGGLLDVSELCKQLELKRPTVGNFVGLLEASHLIYRLLPHGYGKQVLRAQPKIYLADPAIAPSVLLKGKSLLEDAGGLARGVEAAVFKHLFLHYHARGALFSYWRGTRDLEVDIVAETEGRIVPFEVKYQARPRTTLRDLKGLCDLVARRPIPLAYVLTRELSDFGPIADAPTPILRIPASLACLWLGQMEFGPQNPAGFAEP